MHTLLDTWFARNLLCETFHTIVIFYWIPEKKTIKQKMFPVVLVGARVRFQLSLARYSIHVSLRSDSFQPFGQFYGWNFWTPSIVGHHFWQFRSCDAVSAWTEHSFGARGFCIEIVFANHFFFVRETNMFCFIYVVQYKTSTKRSSCIHVRRLNESFRIFS